MIAIGLGLIILGWVLQLLFVSPKNQKISPMFLVAYVFGVFALTFDAFRANHPVTASLQLVSMIMAALVLLRIKK